MTKLTANRDYYDHGYVPGEFLLEGMESKVWLKEVGDKRYRVEIDSDGDGFKELIFFQDDMLHIFNLK